MSGLVIDPGALRWHMAVRGMTARDLAREAGLSAGTVGRWLSGRRSVRDTAAHRLMATLDRIRPNVHIEAAAGPCPGPVVMVVVEQAGERAPDAV